MHAPCDVNLSEPSEEPVKKRLMPRRAVALPRVVAPDTLFLLVSAFARFKLAPICSEAILQRGMAREIELAQVMSSSKPQLLLQGPTGSPCHLIT